MPLNLCLVLARLKLTVLPKVLSIVLRLHAVGLAAVDIRIMRKLQSIRVNLNHVFIVRLGNSALNLLAPATSFWLILCVLTELQRWVSIAIGLAGSARSRHRIRSYCEAIGDHQGQHIAVDVNLETLTIRHASDGERTLRVFFEGRFTMWGSMIIECVVFMHVNGECRR